MQKTKCWQTLEKGNVNWMIFPKHEQISQNRVHECMNARRVSTVRTTLKTGKCRGHGGDERRTHVQQEFVGSFCKMQDKDEMWTQCFLDWMIWYKIESWMAWKRRAFFKTETLYGLWSRRTTVLWSVRRWSHCVTSWRVIWIWLCRVACSWLKRLQVFGMELIAMWWR